MARGARGVTCRECGCLNFSSEHEECDKCRSKALTFRPTARRLATSSGTSGSQRGEDSGSRVHSIGKKRRFDETKNASNKNNEDKDKREHERPAPAPPAAAVAAKKQPDVIDLISSDEEEESVVVKKVITESLKTTRREEEKKEDGGDRVLFQSRVFPTVTFAASDFPSLEEGTQMRKKAVETGFSHSQPTGGKAVITGGKSGQEKASQPTPAVSRVAEETIEPKSAVSRPPPIEEKEVKKTAEKVEGTKSTNVESKVDSATASKVEAQQTEEKAVSSEEEDPFFFQSRIFDAVEFSASDFATVFDGLAKKHPEGVQRTDEEKQRSEPAPVTVKTSANGDGVEFVKVNAAPRELLPVEPPVLGYCSPEFLAFMRECGGDDGDEDDDPEEVSRSQLKLLDVVDLTNLSDSEDSDAESPSPTPRGDTPHENLPANGQPGSVSQSAGVAIVKVSGTGAWYVPTLDGERKRSQPEKVMCELCEEKGLPSRLIRCVTCTKYYHKKCAKENGDENVCWNCELGSMIDDSELDEEHAKHNSEYLAYLKAIRRSPSPEDDGNKEEEQGGDNQEQDGETAAGEEDAKMASPAEGGEDSEANNATKAGKRWMEFIGDATADIDTSYHEVTNRIAEELRDEEKSRFYSRGFVSREEFEAQMTEVEEYYINEEARLQQLEREKAIEAKKAAEARKAQETAEQAANGEQPQKKGAKQATMFSFFSPKKPGQESDENAADSEPKSVAAKRPRSNSPPATKKVSAATSTDKAGSVDQKKAATAKPKAKSKPRAKAKGKTKASPKAKAKPRKKRQPVRFVSPHAAANSEEEDGDDLNDDEDVFNTPEAKRARAELESGGEIVPAGAPISDDAIVEASDVVDISGEDTTTTETVADAEDTDAGEGIDVATEDVVGLTAASANDAAKPTTNVKNTSGKAAKLPPARSNKTTGKTATKRQQKMKEKAAAEAKPIPVEPLEPAIQARVDTYKLKTDELTRQYTELLQSKQESDAIMQDIYGVGLDRDLDVTVDHDKAQQALAETWQKLRDHTHSSSSTVDAVVVLSTVEFPHEVKSLIVKGIQGKTISLSELTSQLRASFKKDLEADDVDMEATETTSTSDSEKLDSAASLAMEMEIKMLAQRTPHGVRPAKANVFEDTSVDALWVWEVGNLEKYFRDEAQKTIKRMRKNRKRLGQQLKTLSRVIQLLHQKPVDEAKVSAEEAKIGKFGFMIDAELQKAKTRETKEQEKRNAAEEKKRHDKERQQAKEAKDEEKRKREREEEEKKKAVSSKRQKRFIAFFGTSSNNAGSSEAAIDMTADQDTEEASHADESDSAKIVRMDAAFAFVGSSGDVTSSSSSIGAVDSSQMSIFSSLKNKRDANKKHADDLSPGGGWSSRRYRDPNLGVMKLLQFYENSRPAYYGTYSSRSPLFRGGRRPLAQYAKFDYSVDSDDEWEEEEPGESLSDDDNDGEESDEDNLDYGDQWLAYEDEVDYMDGVDAEDDPMDRGEGPSSPMKHKLPSQLQKKRVKAKAVKPAKLEPQILGPFWCIDKEMFESTMMRKAREYEEEQKRLEAVRQEQQRKKEQQQEQDKMKAQEKKDEETKPKTEATVTKPAEKTTPAKATTSQKATGSKTTPQKPTAQKSPAKTPAAAPSTAKIASATSPSPAKPSGPPIDSFFKKMAGPVPVPSKPQQPKTQPAETTKDGSVEIISVD
ncbi:hypothetical protein JG687_00014199 [Phytophthora cactorum]|uniref:Chromatin assembly factor 1 subunit A dimerization domain-containing protein n=1 Tax=Phytophthora cactorum TaxID=29920 RepID=A0A8T1TYB2_9STRA|nr:hypothetical protein JG687_00014199 [Phytophthora cactorum]